jgi:hypothetical protein
MLRRAGTGSIQRVLCRRRERESERRGRLRLRNNRNGEERALCLIAAMFSDAYRMLSQRVEAFALLPIARLDSLTLQAKLRDIGRLDDAMAKAMT